MSTANANVLDFTSEELQGSSGQEFSCLIEDSQKIVSESSALETVCAWLQRTRATVHARPSARSTIVCVFTIGTILILFFHSFAAYLSESNLRFLTCAASATDCPACLGERQATIRCPPRCSDSWDDAQVYAVFGSNNTYQGNSKLCRAALHAGAVGATGGCASVIIGGKILTSNGSIANGVQSFAAGFYPFSFSFFASSHMFCGSLQWPLLGWIIACTAMGLAFLPLITWWCCLVIHSFLYCIFTARGESPTDMVLSAFTRGLLLAALARCLWTAVVSPAVTPYNHSRLFLTLYSGALLSTLHFNFLTAILPDIAFDGSAANTSPAAITLLVIVGIVLFGAIAHHVYLVSKLPSRGTYALRYALLATAAASLSGLLAGHASLHLHHYLLALALVPLTRFPGRVSLITQALLLGLLIQGLAFFGPAPLWDARPPGLPPGPRPVLVHGPDVGVAVSWNQSAVPAAAIVAVSINGAWMASGLPPVALQQLAMPGALLDVALALTFPDGSQGPSGPAVSVQL